MDDPSLLKMLSADLQRDIDARIDALAWESAEPDRRALAAVVRHQPSAPVAERLAGLLSHRKSWVRIRVHRLLRDLVSREAYLEFTRQLLQDPEPGHVVRAIRTLSFGKHLPAVRPRCPRCASWWLTPARTGARCSRTSSTAWSSPLTPRLPKALVG